MGGRVSGLVWIFFTSHPPNNCRRGLCLDLSLTVGRVLFMYNSMGTGPTGHQLARPQSPAICRHTSAPLPSHPPLLPPLTLPLHSRPAPQPSDPAPERRGQSPAKAAAAASSAAGGAAWRRVRGPESWKYDGGQLRLERPTAAGREVGMLYGGMHKWGGRRRPSPHEAQG